MKPMPQYGVSGKLQVVWYVWDKWGGGQEELIIGDGAGERN